MVKQGIAILGHDKSKTSLHKGNFQELIALISKRDLGKTKWIRKKTNFQTLYRAAYLIDIPRFIDEDQRLNFKIINW